MALKLTSWLRGRPPLSIASEAAIQASPLTDSQADNFEAAVTSAARTNLINPNILVGMAQQESGLGTFMQSKYSSAAGLYGMEDVQINQINKMFNLGLTRSDTMDLNGFGLTKTTTGVADYLGHYSALYSNSTDPTGIDVAISFWRFWGGEEREKTLEKATFGITSIQSLKSPRNITSTRWSDSNEIESQSIDLIRHYDFMRLWTGG